MEQSSFSLASLIRVVEEDANSLVRMVNNYLHTHPEKNVNTSENLDHILHEVRDGNLESIM